MPLVTNCCGIWDLRAGSRNIAIVSMIYDLLMTALLLLTLLLYIPRVKWEEGEEGEPSRVLFATHSQACQILLIITISVLALHSIPSFLLLYSTWEEATRGVGFWLFMSWLGLLVHWAWIPVPFLFGWALECKVVEVTSIGIVSIFIIYFISVVSSYRKRVLLRDQDMRSKRRLI
ncbi:uncharacterized protein LOC110851941 [Folsomia candida]|uniref:Uncharacterized protein n=1 Tax=Folsomia candida TaxID=158441 RepID=A0A226E461_FOLCA|nr:uncharacterized protein LOC110851941 [Folsomia candida]XP_021955581.1 uncharacterized protein LOC110851941 [Folsomia candida]XP_035709351.1 uncharacterized protein LOC110851941 [Folsomia candida]OXA52068.1 hypothetical protein Fcan01_13299 [Folsomia candida]